jgi:gamma-glutamylputrescine oxidase
MKWSPLLPQDQVYWYTTQQDAQPLTKNITTDVVIIGGGMAGLTAAQSFAQKGCKVIVLEKNYCGSGATGKSSGFITPDSELPLSHMISAYGPDEAKKIWQFIQSGVDTIRSNIINYQIDCDYQTQDTLVVASTKKAFTSDIQAEHRARQQLNYQSTLCTKNQTAELLSSNKYHGAVTYGETFGINAYRYCIGMKRMLHESGVQIHEATPVTAIENHKITTPNATVQAEHIIVCTDHATAGLTSFADKIYHAQTFLMLSAPLSDEQVKRIFPQRPLMVWDTDLIYQYYRLSGDNRLMLGGASLLYTYAREEKHNNRHMIKKLTNYFNAKFPGNAVQFEYIWPGLIGISKDLFPLAGHDKTMPSVYYATAAAGLPWAAALGNYSAERIINDNRTFDEYLSPYRDFRLGHITQKILGTRLTFALSNFLTVGSM